MNVPAWQRLWRFSLVGLLGSAVQLVAVWLLNRRWPAHALLTSLAALELSVLHNFLWHGTFTWRDRTVAHPPGLLRLRFLRFWLSNGAVSLLGSVLLLPNLLHHTRLPLVLANAIVITCCAGLNFLLAERWAFAGSPGHPADAHSTPTHTSPVSNTSASKLASCPFLSSD